MSLVLKYSPVDSKNSSDYEIHKKPINRAVVYCSAFLKRGAGGWGAFVCSPPFPLLKFKFFQDLEVRRQRRRLEIFLLFAIRNASNCYQFTVRYELYYLGVISILRHQEVTILRSLPPFGHHFISNFETPFPPV